MLFDKYDESEEEESDKLGSEYGPIGMFGTRLGGSLHGLGFTLGVTLSDYESCDGDEGSLALPYKNIGEAGTRGCVCTKYTSNNNISSTEPILASKIDLMFQNRL